MGVFNVDGGFFIDACCRREVWLWLEESVFGGQDNLVPASLLGEMEGGGVAIPGSFPC